eukprot:g371.t1
MDYLLNSDISSDEDEPEVQTCCDDVLKKKEDNFPSNRRSDYGADLSVYSKEAAAQIQREFDAEQKKLAKQQNLGASAKDDEKDTVFAEEKDGIYFTSTYPDIRVMEKCVIQMNRKGFDGCDLFSKVNTIEEKDAFELAKRLAEADYSSVMKFPLFGNIFGPLRENENETDQELKDVLSKRIESYLKVEDKSDSKKLSLRALHILFLSISALNGFVQSNFTGPQLSSEACESFLKNIIAVNGKERETSDSLCCLEVESERPYALITHPSLLVLARYALDSLLNWMFDQNIEVQGKMPWSIHFWTARSFLIHQRVMLATLNHQGGSFSLWKSCTELYKKARLYAPSWAMGSLHLEEAILHSISEQHDRHRCALEGAQKSLGMVLTVTGVSGKRTKFQENSTAQLVLLCETRNDKKRNVKNVEKENVGVKNFKLEDVDEYTHLLEHFSLENVPESAVSSLSPLQQALVLAKSEYIMNHSPADHILYDELRAYVSRVVEKPKNSLVQWCALMSRSRMELKVPRRRERAMLQFQEAAGAQDERIRAQFSGGGTTQRHQERAKNAAKAKKTGQKVLKSDFDVKPEHIEAERFEIDTTEDSDSTKTTAYTNDTWTSTRANSAPVTERLRYAYALHITGRWGVQQELGEMYLGLGMIKNALSIFEPLELHDNIVSCYIVMGKQKEASQMIRRLIQEKESPDLWCLLGGVERNHEYFHKAWELSKHRFGRAMRQLGELEMREKKYDQAAKHLKLGLKCNPHRTKNWFHLGNCYLRLEQWDNGADAFRMVVGQNNESGDAWANMAACLSHAEKPLAAFKAMKEAVKELRNWKSWANYAVLAMDAEELSDVVIGINQLLDIAKTRERENVANALPLGTLVELSDTAIQRSKMLQKRQEQDSSLLKDNHFQEALRSSRALMKDINTLLARVSSTVRTDRRIWSICAHWFGQQTPPQYQKAFDCTLKMCRSLQVSGWNDTSEGITRIAKGVVTLEKAAMAMYHASARKSTSEIYSAYMFHQSLNFKFVTNLKVMHRNITVIGACVTDMITTLPHLPRAGETVLAKTFTEGFGGKGANQAVQAARLGSSVSMVGCVGSDAYGKKTIQNFRDQRVNVDCVKITDKYPTGVAPIFVDDFGNNCVAVVLGANDDLTVHDVNFHKQKFVEAHTVVGQLEINIQSTLAAMKIAHGEGCLTMLNTAPARPLSELPLELFDYVKVLCPNETELNLLTSMEVNTTNEVNKAANYLLDKFPKIESVVVTRGSNGVIVVKRSGPKNVSIAISPTSDKAIDTVGAGDSFFGALAHYLSTGKTIFEASRLANICSGFSVTKRGTQTSFPNQKEVSQ